MVERLERLGGLQREEFILLKALLLSNSLTINSSSPPKNGNRREKDIKQEGSADENQSDCIRRIENLRESLLSSLHDCVAVIR